MCPMSPYWVSRVGIAPQSQKSRVQFPVRTHAWVAGSIPVGVHARGNQPTLLSHIQASLYFTLPPFPLL